MKIHDVYSPDNAVEYAARLKEPLRVVPTGFPSLDEQYWKAAQQGIPLGRYVLVAGASFAGKTGLGWHFALQAARHGEACAVVSLEETLEDVQDRLYPLTTSIPHSDFRPDRWDRDLHGATDASMRHTKQLRDDVAKYRLEKLKADLYCVSDVAGDLGWVMSALNDLFAEGVRVFVIDYLQLVRSPEYNNTQITARTEHVSETIRAWARANRCTVFALSQLKRAASENRHRTPIKEDMWGGTSMEANATDVLLVDHSRLEAVDGEPWRKRTWIMVDKVRGGSRLQIPVEINYRQAKYTEVQIEQAEMMWPKHEEKYGTR